MNDQYRVVKPYYAMLGEVPIVLRPGTVLTWDDCGWYLSEPVNGYVVPVDKWNVELWASYFEKVQP
jgi:hypothetical protein